MATLTGGNADEIITPGFISPTVVVDPAGSPLNGVDTIDGAGGADTIDGGAGGDSVLGGTGDDLLIWNPGGGSDVLDGGADIDTHQFNGANIAEVMNLSGGAGGHAILTRNVGAITMDLTAIEHVAIRALGGADAITIGDLRTTDVTRVDIDLAAAGGGADGAVDTVTVGGLASDDHLAVITTGGVTSVTGLGVGLNVTGAETTDALVVSGGLGADLVDISAAGGGIGVVVDGGEGADTVAANGGAGADQISLAGSGDGTTDVLATLTVTLNGATQSGGLRNVELLSVAGGGGADDINAASLRLTTGVDLSGDEGSDTLRGSQGVDTIEGGAGDDFIDGNQGGDVLLGGAGRDLFVWDPGDGSDRIDGGADVDTLQFNGANIGEIMNLFAGAGGHATFTRNVGAITMDLVSVERVSVRALGGADSITVGDLRGTDVRQVDINLAAGVGGDDGAADTVTVGGRADNDSINVQTVGGLSFVAGVGAGVSVTGAGVGDQLVVAGGNGSDVLDLSGALGGVGIGFDGGEGSDTLQFATGGGADQISLTGFGSSSPGDPNPLAITANGLSESGFLQNVELVRISAGAGADMISASGARVAAGLDLSGGDGNDTIFGSQGAETLEGGAGDDFIDGNQGGDIGLGGAGKDTFNWDPGDGSDTLDGGADADALLFNGANIAEVMNLNAAGGHAILTRNVGAITMDLDNIETVSIKALAGSDSITVGDLSGTEVTRVDVDLGTGDDSLSAAALGPGVALNVQGGDGNDSITGGAGQDRFVFAAGETGSDTVTGFQAHGAGAVGDLVVLNGFADHSLADLVTHGHIFESGGSTVITNGAVTIVTLAGTSLASLHANDFLFG